MIKHLGFCIVVIALVVSSTAHAKKKKSKDDANSSETSSTSEPAKVEEKAAAAPAAPAAPEAAAPTPAPVPPPAAPVVTQVAKPVANTEDDPRMYYGLNIFINGGTAMVSSEVKSTGLNATTPKTWGNTYGGTLKYGLRSAPVNVIYGYQTFTVKHEDVSGVTPAGFNQTHTRQDFAVLLHSSSSRDEGFASVGLGYFFENRETDRVTPVVAASAQLSGPVAWLGYTHNWGSKTFGEFTTSVGFPNAFREINTISGQYTFGLNTMSAYRIVHAYTEDLDLGIGAVFKYDMVNYSGSNTTSNGRGIENAKETFMDVAVPVELRFKF